MAKRGDLVALAVLLAVALPLLLIGLDRYPEPWFDEGVKLSGARLLAETGRYGTRSAAGVIPFDFALTSGPFEIGLIALSFKTLGLGAFSGRLPIALLAALLLVLIARIGRDVYDTRTGLFMALTVAAVPPIGELGVILIGRQVLAETPAMALVALGLWLWTRSWRTGRIAPAVAAGVVLGLGMVSKSQFMVATLPVVVLVGAARWWSGVDPPIRAASPAVAMTGVFAAWTVIGRLATDAATRAYNQEMLVEGIWTNILTGLWGRTLTPSAILLAAMSLAGAAYGATLAARTPRARRHEPRFWAVATLSLLAIANTIWFALLSVGWARYAYLGYVAGLMLIGLAVARGVAAAADRLDAVAPGRGRYVAPAVMAGLIALAIAVNVPREVAGSDAGAAAAMAAYVERHVASDSVIETWEWPLQGLGRHVNYHYPGQHYVNQAIYQRGHSQPFAFDYDLLSGNPQYLITGPFSTWTNIYGSAEVARHFDVVNVVGPYVLLRRRGNPAP